MRKTLPKILPLFLLIMGLFSCGNQEAPLDREAEIKEISRVIDSCIGWFKTKDFEMLFNAVAHDPNYISVHPTDRVLKGYDQFEKNSEVFKNPDFIYVRHELKNLMVNLSKSGDVAWFFCVLDDINEYKGQPANWENARWTGVLEKREGRWVIVQQHFSFPTE